MQRAKSFMIPVVLLLTTTAVLHATSTATALTPVEDYDEYMDVFETQVVLEAAADRVFAVISSPGITPSGFAGFSLEHAATQVKLYWKGIVPTAVANAIASEEPEVDFLVVPATYTHAELLAASEDLINNVFPGLAVYPNTITEHTDGRGLTIGLPTYHAPTASTLLTNPVVHVVQQEGAIEPVVNTRLNDGPPYKAGARITDVGTGYGCTTGFAMDMPGTGDHFLLTAAHCVPSQDEVDDGAGTHGRRGKLPTRP